MRYASKKKICPISLKGSLSVKLNAAQGCLWHILNLFRIFIMNSKRNMVQALDVPLNYADRFWKHFWRRSVF